MDKAELPLRSSSLVVGRRGCQGSASPCSDRQGRGNHPILRGLFRQPQEKEPMYPCRITLRRDLDRAPAASSRLRLLNATLLATPRYHRELVLVLRFHLANIVAADSFLGLCQKLNSQVLPFPTDIRVHLRMVWSRLSVRSTHGQFFHRCAHH
jgi:hypothetical protein